MKLKHDKVRVRCDEESERSMESVQYDNDNNDDNNNDKYVRVSEWVSATQV